MSRVAFLFGLSGRSELPGALLVELLGELGTGPGAARQVLTRMRAQGQLTARRAGRGTRHALAGPFGRSVVRLREERGAPPPPPWTGAFHGLLHQVPERHRAYRDRLRRTAGLVGYGPLQPGVLIAAVDRADEIVEVLDDAPSDARVRRVEIAMDRAEAVEAASTAWELPDLARDLGVHRDRLRAALAEDRRPPPGADVLRRLDALTGEVYLDLLRCPPLPDELRPAGWPGADLATLLGEVARTHVPPAVTHLHARLAAHGDGADGDGADGGGLDPTGRAGRMADTPGPDGPVRDHPEERR